MSKQDGKNEIITGLGALLVLVFGYLLLNTINPDILNLNFGLRTIELTIDATVDNTIAEQNTSSQGKNYKMLGTFNDPQPSVGSSKLVEANALLKTDKAEVVRVVADVGGATDTRGTMYFHLSNGMIASAPMGNGARGVAEEGKGVSGDKKTPKGKFVIGGKSGNIKAAFSFSKNQETAILNKQGTNMGALFLGLNIDPAGDYRGIGIHGFASGNVQSTAGCLSLANGDLLLVARYINAGTPISIE